MERIHLLSEIVANKIAAGEVVENPASVIKELIENAIDARADVIDITIQTGGVQLIRVSDNGVGMHHDDAQLCVKRYATSKITDVDDLTSISSYGFRGEALPSISAVSRFKITTCERESDEGTEISLDGGIISQVRAAACAPGTTIEVRDLFYNTPARRKFLRSERYEKAIIADTITAIALSHPDVTFTLQDGKNTLFSYNATTNWLERIESIFGNEFGDIIPIEEKRGDFHVLGIVSKPSLHRVNKSKQFFFINSRYVRYPKLSFALQEAYHGYLLPGRYPYAVLFVRVNPELVDINIHPQKHYVKIADEKELQELVYSVTRAAIETSQSTVSTIADSGVRYTPTAASSRAYTPMLPKGDRTSTVPSTPTEDLFVQSKQEKQGAHTLFQTELLLTEQHPFGIQRILGQLHASYITCETPDSLMLIDQHAAHERIIYEELKAYFSGKESSQQMLLFPVMMDLSHEENVIMEHVVDTIEKYGFTIAHMGNNTYSIQSYPSLFDKLIVKEIVLAVIENFKNESQRSLFANEVETIASIMACKSRSIKAHEKLSEFEMLSLVSDLAHCEDPYHCSHGRPTIIHIDTNEMEKRFGRKG